MNKAITLKLFAALGQYTPSNANSYPVVPGTTVRAVLETVGVPPEKARLVFVDSVRRPLDATLNGGERVAVFPPVGGG